MHKLPKKLALNKLYFLVCLLLSVFFYLGVLTSNVKAQIPSPYVSCDDVRDPEFHSLRPYQKSPCKQEVSQTALFCGNQLVVSDAVSTLQTTLPSLAENCTLIDENDEDKYRCTYNISKSKNVAIDLSNASFPIMGNTEDVVNSQNQSDNLDDGEKTNEYVSWYLSGVTSPVEYGFIGPEDEEDILKIINFSGPINKLLPQRILNDTRTATVEKATDSRHNQIIGCVTLLGKITECSQSGARPVRLTDFNKHLPPKEENYKDFKDYWIAYRRWRGEFCTKIPFTEAFICVKNPLDYWANLFAEIPLSSTEDRVGIVGTETVGVQPVSDDITITDISFSNQEPAKIFFAHMEETTELAKLLQSTYVSKDGDWSGTAITGISPTKACDLTNIRSNPGDDLFAGEITGTLSYSAEFSCDFDSDDFIDTDIQECTKEVLASLSLITETPEADEAWSRLVAGPSGIFKRIFPRVGEGGAILGLLDIPGATNVTYSGDGLIYAGNPSNERSGESAELYFPHVGGISEYFLKGIQTILRPKGFGEQIISGAPGTFPSSGEVDCNQSAPEVSLKGTVDKQEAFQLALRWVSGQTGNHVLECYNDTVKRSKEAGVNPALALWVWIHESNASNYNISDEDFGVHYDKPEGFVNQINGFLNRAKSYTPSHSLCVGKNVTSLEAFAYLYRSGTCEPEGESGGAQNFYNDLVQQWSWISPGCPLPSSPTDLGCP